MAYLADRLDMQEIGDKYQVMADDLLQAIRKNCWDPRNGFYYSVDLDLRPVDRPTKWEFQMGQPRDWDCLIQRLSDVVFHGQERSRRPRELAVLIDRVPIPGYPQPGHQSPSLAGFEGVHRVHVEVPKSDALFLGNGKACRRC